MKIFNPAVQIALLTLAANMSHDSSQAAAATPSAVTPGSVSAPVITGSQGYQLVGDAANDQAAVTAVEGVNKSLADANTALNQSLGTAAANYNQALADAANAYNSANTSAVNGYNSSISSIQNAGCGTLETLAETELSLDLSPPAVVNAPPAVTPAVMPSTAPISPQPATVTSSS